MKIKPKCIDGNIALITAEGRWLPCCQCPDPLYHVEDDYKKTFEDDSFLLENNLKINLKDNMLFKDWLNSIDKNKPHWCIKSCSVDITIKSTSDEEKFTRSKQSYVKFKDKLDLIDFLEENNIDYEPEKLFRFRNNN